MPEHNIWNYDIPDFQKEINQSKPYVFHIFSSKNEDNSTQAPEVKPPKKLKFNLSFPELKENLEEAAENLDS